MTAGVPQKVASIQAEVIASQLGRDAFVKAESTQEEPRPTQRR
ncbi:hypothetical protein [Pandoraea sputorum]|nr:hypothetical protein [Pandoraea sputorum]